MEFQSQISLDLLSNSTKILENLLLCKARKQENTLANYKYKVKNLPGAIL